MEARVGAAYWTPDGRLVHYSSCQGGHVTKSMLCAVYGLEPGTGARGRARRRRRVRGQVAHVSGGGGARVLRPPARPSGAMDRDPQRELPVDATGPRPGAVRQDRRHPRRAHHGLSARRRPGRRRLPADRLGPARHDDAHDVRRLRHRQRRLHRGVDGDEHAVDHRLPRCRPTRGGGGDRAHGRPLRGRDRHRPGRGAPSQHDPEVPRGAHHRRRHRRTTSATTRDRSSWRSRRPATTSCAPSRPRAAHPAIRCRSGSASPPTSRSPPASAGRSSAPSSCSPTAG